MEGTGLGSDHGCVVHVDCVMGCCNDLRPFRLILFCLIPFHLTKRALVPFRPIIFLLKTLDLLHCLFCLNIC